MRKVLLCSVSLLDGKRDGANNLLNATTPKHQHININLPPGMKFLQNDGPIGDICIFGGKYNKYYSKGEGDRDIFWKQISVLLSQCNLNFMLNDFTAPKTRGSNPAIDDTTAAHTANNRVCTTRRL